MKSKNARWTKELAIDTYKKIRKKYGDKAKSSWWVSQRHSGLIKYVRNSFGGWDHFKFLAGFNEKPLTTMWTKESAIKEYKTLRKKHGDKAKSIVWIRQNGFRGLNNWVNKNIGSWSVFRTEAGFSDKPFYMSWTPELAIKAYQKARKKHGDKAKNYGWMQENGYNGLIQYIRKPFKGWDEFKKKAGFNEGLLSVRWNLKLAIKTYREIRKKHGEKARSSTYVIKQGYRGMYGYICGTLNIYWNEFKKKAGFNEDPLNIRWTPELAIKAYQKAREKHGDKAKSNGWMAKNGYGGLILFLKNYMKIGWNEFKKKAGFNDDPLRIIWTPETAIIVYKKAKTQYGNKVRSSGWMNGNGYSGLVSFACKNFRSWQKFLDFYNFSYNMDDKELKI